MRRVVLVVALMVAACDDMAQQDRAAVPQDPPLPPVAGTVARGDLAVFDGPVDAERGADRFAIHCTPCHGPTGLGDGPVAGRLMPAPPTFAEADVTEVADVVAVIEQGSGPMPSYAGRLTPADRHAVAAHVLRLRGEQQ